MSASRSRILGQVTPKYGMTLVSFPNQSLSDAVYTVDAAHNDANFDFKAYATQLGTNAPNHQLIGIDQYLTNESTSRVKYTFAQVPGPAFYSSVLLPDGQVGTKSIQRVTVGTVASEGALVEQSQVERESDASAIKTTITKPLVLPLSQYQVDTTPSLPRKWMHALGLTTTSQTVEGTAALPTLSGGDIARSEQQISKYVKRTSATTLNTSTVVAFTGETLETSWGGGGILVTTETNGTTAEPDRFTKTFNRDVYPNGVVITTQEKLQGFPTLFGSDFDTATGMIVPYTETWVPAGTQGYSTATGRISEVKPINHLNSLEVVRDLQLPEGEEVFTVYEPYRLPDELVSWTLISEDSYGSGGTNQQYGAQSYRVSRSSHGEVVLGWRQAKSGSLPGTLYRKWFFSLTDAQAWVTLKKGTALTTFQPTGGDIVVYGTSISYSENRATYGGEITSSSSDISNSVSAKNISNCLCAGFFGEQRSTGVFVANNPIYTKAVANIPASDPPSLSVVTQICSRSSVERRGRYYVAEVVILNYA